MCENFLLVNGKQRCLPLPERKKSHNLFANCQSRITFKTVFITLDTSNMASKHTNSIISSNSIKELGCFAIAIIAIIIIS